MKNMLKENWNQRKEKAQADMDPERTIRDATWHSKYYHDQFEGYTELMVSENGRMKIRRIYTGEFYCADLPEGKRRVRRILYWFLYIAAVLLYIFSATRNASCNYFSQVSLLQALAIPLLFWLSVALTNLLTHDVLKEREHRLGSGWTKISSMMSAGCFLVMAVMMAILTLQSHSGFGSAEFQCVGINLLTAGILLLICFWEHNISYREIPNENSTLAC